MLAYKTQWASHELNCCRSPSYIGQPPLVMFGFWNLAQLLNFVVFYSWNVFVLFLMGISAPPTPPQQPFSWLLTLDSGSRRFCRDLCW